VLGRDGPDTLDEEDLARNNFGGAIEILERLESRLKLASALGLPGNDEDLARAKDLFEACGAI